MAVDKIKLANKRWKREHKRKQILKKRRAGALRERDEENKTKKLIRTMPMWTPGDEL